MLKKERKSLFLKITVSIMLTVFIMMTPNYKQAEGNEIRIGDVNGDGNINLTDLVCMLRHIAAEKSNKNEGWLLTKEQIKAGDIIKDEKIDSSDVLALLRYMAANKSTSVAEKHKEWLELEKTEDTDKTEEEIQKDKIGPKIEKIEAISKAGNYKTGEEIQIKVTFDEKIYAGKNKVALSNKTIPILNISFGEGEIKHPYVEENSKIEKSIIYKYQITGEDKGELKVTGAKAFDGTKTICDEAGNEVTLVAGRDLTGNRITANEETGNSSITKIVLDKKEMTLDMNGAKTAKITAIVTPSETNLTWTSSNNKVAIVDEKTGIVTALEEGKTDIIVKAADGIQETCKVTVKNSVVEVTEISLNKTNLDIEENDGERLSATVQPSNATNQKVTWSSSNSNIATVNDGGFVTGKKEGAATITAKTANGKTATCQVVVKKPIIEVTSISLNETSINLQENEGERLTATVQPSNATNPKVTWSSSNSDVASVSDSGFVTSRKEGTATITAKTANGKTATCQVTIKNLVIEVTGVSFDKTSITISQGKSAQITATLQPANATNKTVTWSSSNTSIATVSNKGKIIAKKGGTTTITAKSNNGKTATCKVTVQYSTSSTTKTKSVKGDGYSETITIANRTFKLYKQYAGSYSNDHFNSVRNSSAKGSIANMGCGPSSIAIILSGYGYKYDPGDVGRLLLKNSKPSGKPSMVKELRNLGRNTISHEYNSNYSQVYNQMKNALLEGHQIVLYVGKGPGTQKSAWSNFTDSGYHFISVLGIDSDNDKVFVGNPNGKGNKWYSLSTVVKARGNSNGNMAGWIEVY